MIAEQMTVRQMKDIQSKNVQLAKSNIEILTELSKTQDELATVKRNLFTSQATLSASFLRSLGKELDEKIRNVVSSTIGTALTRDVTEVITHKRLSGEVTALSVPTSSGVPDRSFGRSFLSTEEKENHRRLSFDRMASKLIDSRRVCPSVVDGILTPVAEVSSNLSMSSAANSTLTVSNYENIEARRHSTFAPSNHSTESKASKSYFSKRKCVARPSIFDFDPGDINIELLQSPKEGQEETVRFSEMDHSFVPSTSFLEHSSWLEAVCGNSNTTVRESKCSDLTPQRTTKSTRTATIMPQDYGDLTDSPDSGENEADEREESTTPIPEEDEEDSPEPVKSRSKRSAGTKRNDSKKPKSQRKVSSKRSEPTETPAPSKQLTAKSRGTTSSAGSDIAVDDTYEPTLTNMSSILDTSARERRSRKPVSYKEPPTHGKIRRGDPQWCKQ